MIDHIIFGVPELQSGMELIRELFGLRPVYGGKHPGYGTHNALLGLGPGRYLEIIAPDPEQPAADRPLWMGLDQLTAPRLIRWAAGSDDLPEVCRKAAVAGIDLGSVFPGQRSTADGRQLQWQLTDPRREICGGLIPFFIDWGNVFHPSDQLPQAGVLTELWAEHPRPSQVQQQLKALDLEMRVEKGSQAQLYAQIEAAGRQILLSSLP